MNTAPPLAQEFASEFSRLLIVEHRCGVDVADTLPVQELPPQSLGVVGLGDRDAGEPDHIAPTADEF
jgi:hypothetical protein